MKNPKLLLLSLLKLRTFIVAGFLLITAPSCSSAQEKAPNVKIESKVTIRDDQTFLVNGKPFFPIGLYYVADEIADKTGQGLADLRKMGFNTIFYNGGLGDKEKLDRIAVAGLRVWYRPPGGLYESFDEMKKVAEAFRTHPALLFWEHSDEPVLNGVDIEKAKQGYQIMKQTDPDHPVLCVQWPDWKTPSQFGTKKQDPEILKRWASISDVYGFDVYPVPLKRWWYQAADIPNGWPYSIAIMGHVVDWFQSMAPNKPILPVLQAWAWKPTEDGKDGYPSYQQSRYMAYQVVIHGAKGINYYGQFRVSTPNTAAGIPEKINEDPKKAAEDFARAKELNSWFWSYFKDVVKEVAEMSPVFTARDADWKPQVKFVGQTLTRLNQIEFRVKQQGNSAVILMVNSSDYPATVRITAPKLAGKKIHCWHEMRQFQAGKQGTFVGRLQPYDVRVYSDVLPLPLGVSPVVTIDPRNVRFNSVASKRQYFTVSKSKLGTS